MEEIIVVELEDRSTRHDPEPEALSAPSVELSGVVKRQVLVRGDHLSAVTHRIALALLAEDLVDLLALAGRSLPVAPRRRRFVAHGG